MVDPLAEMVQLLQPETPAFMKVIGAGSWEIARDQVDRPYFCVVLQGRCNLVIDAGEPMVLEQGDFVLVPSAGSFKVTSPADEVAPKLAAPMTMSGDICRFGDTEMPANAVLLTGYCDFASPDADVLTALMPGHIHVRGQERFSVLVTMADVEIEDDRPGRSMVLGHLLELLFIEALRSAVNQTGLAGLLRGLSDDRIGPAIRLIHQNPSKDWTVALLAREAALSRSAFFERFQLVTGVSPIAYLSNWRMALANKELRHGKLSMGAIANQLGYTSANSFSIAFTRRFGIAPTRYRSELVEAL